MQFLNEHSPTRESNWRGIILFGDNVASYKFALGKALLELAAQGITFVTLDQLAEPYTRHLVEHIRKTNKQSTSSTSRFLDVCRSFARGEIGSDALHEQAVQLGFNNVIDAFHNVNGAPVPTRFYVDERRTRRGITLTDDLLQLARSNQFGSLPHETEARWRLVETAWSLGIASTLLQIGYDPDGKELFIPIRDHRRVTVTSSRDALNGYQKGKCFYCFADISIVPGDAALADVDHVIPHMLGVLDLSLNLNGVWNLVLACSTCKRGIGGKLACVPEPRLMERLARRNTFFVESHHPLRETIIAQTGRTELERLKHLERVYKIAKDHLNRVWRPEFENEPAF